MTASYFRGLAGLCALVPALILGISGSARAGDVTTTASVSGPQGSDGWYTGTVSVSLDASTSDPSADISATYYTVDGSKSEGDSFSVSGDGPHQITYWSEDSDGDVESASSLGIDIDTTPPFLDFDDPDPSPNSTGWNNAPVEIGFRYGDDTSGVVNVSPSNAVEISGEGVGLTEDVTVTDDAGNQAVFTSPGVNIDLTPPSTYADVRSIPDGKRITLSASDNLSGVVDTFYTVDGGDGQSYDGAFSILGPGTHVVRYYSIDAADNVESVETTRVSVSAPDVLTTLPAGLQMFSVPEDLSGLPLGLVMSDDVILATWVPQTLQYAITPMAPADGLRPGQAYWARFAQSTQVYDLGSSPATQNDVRVSLKRGWNMVGNPRFIPVDMTTLQVQDGAGHTYSLSAAGQANLLSPLLYSYPAGSTAYQRQTAGVLAPFLGYWVHAYSDCTLVFPGTGDSA